MKAPRKGVVTWEEIARNLYSLNLTLVKKKKMFDFKTPIKVVKKLIKEL